MDVMWCWKEFTLETLVALPKLVGPSRSSVQAGVGSDKVKTAWEGSVKESDL
jgi:hypothetical protein